MASQLLSLEKVLDFILTDAVENPATTTVPLSEAPGLVLAEDQHTAVNVPAFDNSAMDGYAVNTADLDTPGCTLPVAQTIAAGHPGVALEPGTAARIFTGAPIPEGADAVVIQENTRAEDDRVAIMELPAIGANIRRQGHDVSQGEVVLARGHRLLPQDLGLLASLGVASVCVKAPLKVAIINTGDEVIAPGQALKPGQLYDSNSYTLEGLLRGLGMTVIKKGIVDDSLEKTQQALSDAASEVDCIISTGGVSVGDEDHVRPAVEKLGRLSLWKLAIKPGKPFSYGRIKEVPFFGLPGNPVAVFVTFVMLVRPCLLKMQGAAALKPPLIRARAGFEMTKAGSRLEFIRVRLVTTYKGQQALYKGQQALDEERQELVPFPNQGSSIMTSLSWADGLAEIPLGETVSRGQWLNYIPFRGIL